MFLHLLLFCAVTLFHSECIDAAGSWGYSDNGAFWMYILSNLKMTIFHVCVVLF